MNAAIEMSGVTKSYRRNPALDALSLKVQEGEIYGFIGPNGAGKSTAIRLMLNFIRAQAGTISVLGLDPRTEDVAIKRMTGYVAGEAFLYADMRVGDLLQFTQHFHRISVPARVKLLVDTLEIDVHKRFEMLSFGNRKKVAIACALLHSPRLLILDEPSNGLDPVIRGNLYDLLRAEQRRGATIFFSSHVLAEVRAVCTRIGLIKQGRLIKETDTASFTHIGYSKVSLKTSEGVSLEALAGVSGLQRDGDTCRFMYAGKPDPLIRLLSQVSVSELQIEEPDLETVFKHYFNDQD
ncbi:MAG: hypothetical protein RLZZ165_603 [Bacteroidota bacterium]